MAILQFVYVSFSTMFMLVSTVLVGFLLVSRLSAPHRTSRGLSYVTLRIFLSSMLFGNLCLDISPQFMQRYYWASIMSLVPMLLGAAFAYSLRRLVMKEWRVLLLLGSTFQNGLVFPLSVVTNMRGVAWLDARARKDCQQYVFLYNLTCAIGLWAIGSPLIKYHKDKLVAQRAEALAASMYEMQTNVQSRNTSEQVGENTEGSPAAEGRRVVIAPCPFCGRRKGIAVVDVGTCGEPTPGCDAARCSCPKDPHDVQQNIRSSSSSNISGERGCAHCARRHLPWRTTAAAAMSHYQPARHMDRPIAMAKYDRAYHYTPASPPAASHIQPFSSDPLCAAVPMTAMSSPSAACSPAARQMWCALRYRPAPPRPWLHYIWLFINRAVVSRDKAVEHYRRHRREGCAGAGGHAESDEEDIRLYHHERPLSVHLRRIGRVVWGALMTVPVKLTLLAIAISVTPPLRWCAQSPPGRAVLSAIAEIGKACVPSQLLLLGIILGIRHKHDDLAEDDQAEREGHGGDEEDDNVRRQQQAHHEHNTTDNNTNSDNNSSNRDHAVKLSWWRRRMPNSVRFVVITIVLRLLCIPALSFLLIHMLLRWRVLPADKPFVVSILIGTSSPAAVNASLVCTMHQYHASAFSRMMIWMHCVAIVTSTFWLTVSIAYTNALPD